MSYKREKTEDTSLYSDDPAPEIDESQSRTNNVLNVILVGLAVALFGNTLASNINLSSGDKQEFGQGIIQFVNCDSDGIELKPRTEMITGSLGSSLQVSGLRISNIAADCLGKQIDVKFFQNSEQFPSAISKYFALASFVFQQVSTLSGNGFALKAGNDWVDFDFNFPMLPGGTELKVTVESSEPEQKIKGKAEQQFGNSGVFIETTGRLEPAQTATVDAEGNIYVVARSRAGSDIQLVIRKYSENGVLDQSFGNVGISRTSLSGFPAFNEIALNRANHIFVLGSQSDEGKIWGFNPDGSIDLEFGQGGVFSLGIPGKDRTYIDAATLDKNENFILAGHSCDDTANRCNPYIAQVTHQGWLNEEFASNGLKDINTSVDTFLNAVTVDFSGEIFACGDTMENTDGKIVGYKFKNNGEFDSLFGTNGKVDFDFVNTQESCLAIELNPLGGVFYAGYTTVASVDQALVLSLDNSGQIDTNFGVNGKALLSPIPNQNFWSSSITVAQNGDIYLNALDFSNNTRGAYLARITFNGNLDTSFGESGFYKAGFQNSSWDWLSGLLLGPRDNVYIYGYTGSNASSIRGYLQSVK